MIAIRARKQKNIPKKDARSNGAVENEVIPSIAYLHNPKKDHLVLPAALFTFS